MKKKIWRFGIMKKKKQKRLQCYCLEALLISLFITTFLFVFISLDIIYINFYTIVPTNAILAILLVLVSLLLALFAFIFIIDYSFSEFLVRKYHSLLK